MPALQDVRVRAKLPLVGGDQLGTVLGAWRGLEVEQLGEVQLRAVVERQPGDRLKQTIEMTQDCKWKNHFAVFVALVGAPEQVADAPNEAGELGVAVRVMRLSQVPP